MTDNVYSSPLLRRVQHLVHTRPKGLYLKALAKELGVTERWLVMFSAGKCENPNARVIEKLYVILSGEQIFND